MNDNADISTLVGSIRDDETIGVLRAILKDAEAGNIVSVGVIAVTGRGQIGAFAAGKRLTEIYLGADILKANILASMQKPAKSPLVG